LKTTYDIIIIGAGLGGLESAYILSKAGYSVCVLEKNKNVGGTLQQFSLGDCQFSSGMHYLGSLDEGQVLNKLFKYFNILDGLKLKRMDADCFDKFNIGGKEIEYPIGWENFEKKMAEYFPEEKTAISAYVQLMKEVSNKQDIYNLRFPKDADIRLNPYLQQGIYPTIQSLTKNKDLQNALCALNFVYAGDMESSSVYAHALINNYYINSAWRLVGGSSQVADLLAKNIEELGGEIYSQAEVSEFLFKEKELVGVKTKDGQEVFGKQFISNMHPAITLEKIAEGKIRKSFRHRLENIPNTISVFGLHVRLKPSKVFYKNYNYHFYKENDVWAVNSYSKNKLPSFYYLYFPAGKQKDEFADCVSIYTYMHFDEVKKWEGLPLEKRGTEYEDWKKLKATALLDLVAENFPEIKEDTLDWIAATPLTYRDYIGSPGGAMYGTLRDYHDPMSSYIFAKTKIPNLFFTGQNNNLHGMLGVSISALMTCGEIVGLEKLINEVNEQ